MFKLIVLVYPGEELSWEGTKRDAPSQVPRGTCTSSRTRETLESLGQVELGLTGNECWHSSPCTSRGVGSTDFPRRSPGVIGAVWSRL